MHYFSRLPVIRTIYEVAINHRDEFNKTLIKNDTVNTVIFINNPVQLPGILHKPIISSKRNVTFVSGDARRVLKYFAQCILPTEHRRCRQIGEKNVSDLYIVTMGRYLDLGLWP